MKAAIFYFGALIMGVVLFPFVISLAKKLKVLSPEDYRRKSQTPLMGGLVIYFTAVFFSVVYEMSELRLILLFSLPLVAVSLLDDIIEVNSKIRAGIQVLCVFGWLYFTPNSEIILTQWDMSPFLLYPLVIFWVVGIINALNMIDGQDLEAGSFSLVVCSALAIMYRGQPEMYFLLTVAGSLSAFMLFNKPPAKIYMGDCGSMFLGFALACLSLKMPLVKGPSLSYIFVPLMLFSFPQMDAVLAIFRRLRNSGSIMAPDKDHIHHRLQKVGFSIKQSALIIICIVFYGAVTALANFYFIGKVQILTVNFLSISGMLMALGALSFVEVKMASQVSNMSQSLIQKYLNGASSNIVPKQSKFYLVVYDLLPYYKEIQLRGITEVNEFVKSFSEFIKENHDESLYHFFGSYTVVTVAHESYAACDKNDLVEQYYAFLEGHEVMKSKSPIPWGMSFYSHKSKGENPLKKFGIIGKEQAIIKEVKSA